MCGIIGYTGEQQVAEILLHGLKRLEYRGYDSSGIGILHRRKIRQHKKAGGLGNLIESIDLGSTEGQIGIAHTRWATHGGVTDSNAHPHTSANGLVALVHNGIIDNYQPLKDWLVGKGYKFASETDSEVLAHLIEYELLNAAGAKSSAGVVAEGVGNAATGSSGASIGSGATGSSSANPGTRTSKAPGLSDEYRLPLEAVVRALEQVRGTWGLVILFRDYPDLLIAAKNGSPLAVGLASDGVYIASDPIAFGAYTREVIFMEDRELAVLSPGRFTILDSARTAVNRAVETLDVRNADVSKGEYGDYLEKEIFEQPESLRRAFGNGGRLDRDFGTARLGGIDLDGTAIRNLSAVYTIGMGTALNAGVIGARMFETLARIPAQALDASELRWSNPLVQDRTAYFAISQSGETLDTLLAVKELQNRGAKIYGIVNAVGSSLARACGAGVYIHAGPEISVASTKAFTGQVSALFLLALSFGRVRHLSPSEGQALLAALERIPTQINHILAQSSQIEAIARKYKAARSMLFLGRGISHAVAMEGALKLKELSYIHAEAFSAGNLKHGPLALIDEHTPSLFIAPEGETFDKILSNIQEVRARNGRVIVVTNSDSKQVEALADDMIRIPACPEILSPLLSIIPMQLLALSMTRALGRNVDQPRNLAKSVTTE